MKRLFYFALTVLFLISVCFTLSATADELKFEGGPGERHPQVFGVVYISLNPYSIWYADGTHAYSMIDHGYVVWNFSDRSYTYDYEFKQWLSEYNIEEGQAGALINEAKILGSGNLGRNGQQVSGYSFTYHYLPEWNLVEDRWYQVGGYTRLSVRRGGVPDSWQVYSNTMEFQWEEPDN